MPFRQNSFFCQRDEELRQLRQGFAEEGVDGRASLTPITQAVVGLGGVGKSQLALCYAYSFAQNYHFVCWLDATSLSSLLEDFRRLAKSLGGNDFEAKDAQPQSGVETSEKQLVASISEFLRQHYPEDKPWLLIFDNANDLEGIESLLPVWGNGHVLLTSRNPNLERAGVISPSELATWTPAQGANFLRRRLGKQAVASPSETAWNVFEEISREVGGLPLALEQVGAYLTVNRSDPSSYLKLFQSKRLELLERSKVLSSPYSGTVATTWTLNFDQVQSRSPASSDLLRAMAFLGESSVPLSIFIHPDTQWGAFSALVDQEEIRESRELLLDQALSPLLSYSLIGRAIGEDCCRVHPLVREVTRESLRPEDKKLWAERIIGNLATTLSYGLFRSWEQSGLILPHAVAAFQWIEKFDLRDLVTANFLMHTANHLTYRGYFDQSLKFVERSLEIIGELEAGEPQELQRSTALLVRGDL